MPFSNGTLLRDSGTVSAIPLASVQFHSNFQWPLHARSAPGLTAQECRGGLIAVNYAARSHGVTRFMKVAEASTACPDIQFIHVEVLGALLRAHLC